jgi:pimeloyl-ACP methyl ester carboxylesterase
VLKRASVGGFALAYHDAGEGLPLVMVHGFPLDHSLWRHQLDALASRCRVIAPDLRGYGESDAPPPPYRMRDFAEDLRALTDHLRLEQVILGGLSMGGYIALAFADRYPERLRGFALLATRADPDSAEGRRGRIETAARARQDGVAALADDLAARILGDRPVDSEVAACLHRMILATSLDGLIGSLEAMAARPDTHPVLATLECPSLVVVGSEDHLTPPACAREMAAALRDVELVEVPAAGHLVVLERPEPVNAALERLVERSGG